MNRIRARRYVINTFWTIIYTFCVGYLLFANIGTFSKKVDQLIIDSMEDKNATEVTHTR